MLKNFKEKAVILIFCFFCIKSVFLTSDEKRVSSAPFISGDTFRSICDFLYDETSVSFDPNSVFRGGIIFVKTDMLDKFFCEKHPFIKEPYVLVSHNSDAHIPGIFAKYLDDQKIICWFGQNVFRYKHPKLRCIPIGLANQYWGHGSILELKNAITRNIKKDHREHLCYLNFSIQNFSKERQRVFDIFSKKGYCTITEVLGFPQYLDFLGNSKFVLSPRGNGIDCHRTWEALYMGAVPIVKSSSLDPLYVNLPVLVVRSWKDIKENRLKTLWESYEKNGYNTEKLFFEYWKKEIFNAAERC